MGNSPSRPPEVRPITSATLPQPLVDEINTWLCNNAVLLFNKVAESHFRGFIEIRKIKKRKQGYDFAYDVIRQRVVRRLPVYVNVAYAAKHVLIDYIKRSMDESERETTSVYFKCGHQTYEILLSNVEEEVGMTAPPRVGLASKEQPEFVENVQLEKFIETKVPLDHPVKYWRIINMANVYDRNPGRFIQALKRAELKWGANKKIWRQVFAGVVVIPANFTERLHGIEKAATENWGKFDADRADFKRQLYRMMPDLVPIASLCQAVRQYTAVENKRTASSHHHPRHEYSEEVIAILQNDRCNRFWNSRYLFHLDEEEGRKGMAIDTMTGIVTNVDFRYKHNRYEFTHSRATTRRWARFCEREDGEFPWEKFRVLTRDMWMRINNEVSVADV